MKDMFNYDPVIDIEFDGVPFRLFLAYNRVINAMRVMSFEPLLLVDRFYKALENLLDYKNYPQNWESLTLLTIEGHEALYSFIVNEYIKLDDDSEEEPKNKKNKRVFDIEHDFPLIVASFIKAYNIDLNEEKEFLSWRKFNVLLQELPDDTALKNAFKFRQSKKPKRKNYNDYEEYKQAVEAWEAGKERYKLPPELVFNKEQLQQFQKEIHQIKYEKDNGVSII